MENLPPIQTEQEYQEVLNLYLSLKFEKELSGLSEEKEKTFNDTEKLIKDYQDKITE